MSLQRWTRHWNMKSRGSRLQQAKLWTPMRVTMLDSNRCPITHHSSPLLSSNSQAITRESLRCSTISISPMPMSRTNRCSTTTMLFQIWCSRTPSGDHFRDWILVRVPLQWSQKTPRFLSAKAAAPCNQGLSSETAHMFDSSVHSLTPIVFSSFSFWCSYFLFHWFGSV